MAGGAAGSIGRALECDLDRAPEFAWHNMRVAVRRAQYDKALLERLDEAEDPLWLAIREAIDDSESNY